MTMQIYILVAYCFYLNFYCYNVNFVCYFYKKTVCTYVQVRQLNVHNVNLFFNRGISTGIILSRS